MDDDGVYYEANWHSLWVTSLKLFQSILLQLRSCTHGHIGEKAADLWITALQQTVVGSKRFLSALEAFTISETQQDFYFTWHLEEILRATEIATLLNTVSSPKPDITRAVQRGFLRLHRYRINRYTMVSAPEKEEEERKRMEEITVEIVGQQLLYFFSRSPLTVTCLGAAPMLVFAPLPNSGVKADVFSPERLTSVYHPYGMGVVCTLNLIREFIKHELLILKSSGEILLNSAVNSRMGSVESTPRGGFVRQAPDMTPPTKDEQTLYKEVHAGIAPQHMRNIKLALSIVCVAAHELVTLQKKMLFEYTTVRQDLAYVLEKLIGLLEGIENNSLGDVDNELARFVSNSRNILTERLRTI
ncbi:hypothetical protein ADEAN_000063600 [Angomonas deanei]|uniref:Uncharacterized protein n=1 Tax=Angomonas deanei TaxID=59799 RepID=A0A7G2C0I5_9TRYP|nr:hypothetical protein ADEAN_000063600 [Angomonas deanei]